MCIICVKPQGVKLPDNSKLQNMFTNNPHGAGFMYTKDGKVEIRKGFMTYADFKLALDKACAEGADAGAMVMHFRITTHGGTCPQNTHPFPLTDNIGELRSLATNCDVGVAHNGIINIKTRNKETSDTQEFIASVLTPVYKCDPKFWESERIRNGIAEAINGSRMAILTGAGEVCMIGNFIVNDGCCYSNDSFEPFDSRWFNWLDELDKLDGGSRDCPPWSGKHKRKTKRQRKLEKKAKMAAATDTRESVRMPWEQYSTIILKLMPLAPNEYVVGEEGVEYEGPYHAIDGMGRIFYIDPENAFAYETYDTVQNGKRYDKRLAEYYELQ